MDLSALPDDLATAMAESGLTSTGEPGPSGGWLVRADGGGLAELVVADDEGTGPLAAAVHHEHLLPIREVLPLPEGRCGVLVDHVPAVTLEAVCHARVPLTDAEAATVAIPIAQALDALHAVGLAYGRLGPEDVLLTSEGKPVLAARTYREGPADGDLPGLLTTVLTVLAPEVPEGIFAGHDELYDEPSLRPVLERLLAEGCPSGDAVVSECLATVRPEPIQIPAGVGRGQAAEAGAVHMVVRTPAAPLPRPGRASGGQVPTRRDARRRARRRSRLVTGGLAVLAVVVALVVLRPAGEVRAEDVGGTPAVPSAPTAVDPVTDRSSPTEAAAVLTRLRASALTTGDPARLAVVDVIDGPAYAADEALIETVGADRIAGLSVDVREVRAVPCDATADGADVCVEVTAAMSPYVRTAAEGTSTTVPGTAPRTVVLALRWGEDGWRVWEVREPARA